MRVARHHRVTGASRLFQKSTGPLCEPLDDALDLLANIEAKVGGNLLIAAAARVKLETERSNLLRQPQLDKMMNVLGRRIVANPLFVRIRRKLRRNRVQRPTQLSGFTLGHNPCRAQSRRMCLARGNLLRQQLPVEGQRPLPGFKLRIERLTETAGPHLHFKFLQNRAQSRPPTESAQAGKSRSAYRLFALEARSI